jgi:hypothetical protein
MKSPCRCARRVGKGYGGNREVSPPLILGARGDLSGAGGEATLKEGGAWGKHGFPHGREPKATDAPGAPTSEIVDFLKGKIPV